MRLSLSITALLTATVACGPKSNKKNAAAKQSLTTQAEAIGIPTQSKPSAEGSTEPSIEVLSEDINGDQRDDVYYVSTRDENGAVLVRRELDLNWDGQIDMRSWLDENGEVVREEMDGDFDGWVDWIDHYKPGQIRWKAEADTDYNHAIDLVILFQPESQRVERQLDTDGDGRLERRENWTMGENETLTCTEIDADGDGKYEVQFGEGCTPNG